MMTFLSNTDVIILLLFLIVFILLLISLLLTQLVLILLYFLPLLVLLIILFSTIFPIRPPTSTNASDQPCSQTITVVLNSEIEFVQRDISLWTTVQ